jgi:hypothetical protein
VLLEPADALFEEAWLIHHDVSEDLIEQVTVAVDQSGGADESVSSRPPSSATDVSRC